MLFQHITVRPEPVEGQTVVLGNSPYFISILSLALKILLTEVKCILRWSATSL